MDSMDQKDWLAERFEADRGQLRAVAYRMLGSVAEAEDAVQEAWLRLNRADTTEVRNLSAWLTTVVGRVCLDMLRTRRSRREESLDTYVPDPIVGRADGTDAGDPESEAVRVDSVGLALLVVLQTLAPAERLAFVLHDMFAVPFEDIAPIVDRTPAAARQLASRARRQVQGAAPNAEVDRARQREVVEAFLAASRSGDFEALVAVLDPDVVLRADNGVGHPATHLIRGARTVAAGALTFSRYAAYSRVALVNGEIGVVNIPDGGLMAVLSVTVSNGKIVEINILADQARLPNVDVSALAD